MMALISRKVNTVSRLLAKDLLVCLRTIADDFMIHPPVELYMRFVMYRLRELDTRLQG